ncbi:major Facilitator Superfamily protein [Bordetella holmesii 70147]|uniref:Vacuole effluxer Atg22-like protein n=2 Tax=Bordetella holmesii TaxID=35814 RepID=A0A158M4S3_9BORD|nr:major Facilitator Superfamily protein [Bordetella holmesii ATCC 51541]AIT26986.1 major Facilitator Superfamily protein [Bordetella holmesii 44057]EWM51739.1 major Facilitator Superfamily protein [Bordetella holmesii 70147]KAK82671.1 vacuole effluxer Atg22-like protein [Bordetella holmesii CDC-H572-BH]KAK89990.1 vacuole effluxer Atg22-like protein [Bordetella holmesii CDC-H585-BH]KCV08515.1 vacuole effluxer Atg22-like protein [Bordetella holmesii CDC-H785-BH]
MLNPGVRRREVWAWAMYDFANSGYTTVILTTVFSTYFVAVVGQRAHWATLAWTAALSLSYLAIMLTMPTLGARADAHAGKRWLLYTSTIGCVLATLLLTRVGPGDVWLALVAVAISNYCYCIGESVVAAFLPELARPAALGRVSGWGWSFGYCGGMLTLGLCLAVVTRGEAIGQSAENYVPWVIAVTCLVFALAALPSFFLLRERARPHAVTLAAPDMLRRLARAWHETGEHFPEFRRLLMCGACYQAGIAVVITLAAIYAEQVMGFSMPQIMLLVFTVNIAAAIGAFSFGYVQDRIGHKRALALTLVGWIIMVLVAYAATTVPVFWVAATLAGLCMGTSQSAGRAMTGAMAPAGRLAEFFALWTFAVQLAAVVGPLTYGLVTWLTAGNHRLAILVTGLFFVAGLLLLARVDLVRGIARSQQV